MISRAGGVSRQPLAMAADERVPASVEAEIVHESGGERDQGLDLGAGRRAGLERRLFSVSDIGVDLPLAAKIPEQSDADVVGVHPAGVGAAAIERRAGMDPSAGVDSEVVAGFAEPAPDGAARRDHSLKNLSDQPGGSLPESIIGIRAFPKTVRTLVFVSAINIF